MHEQGVYIICRAGAAITAIVGKNKFIPAQGLAAVAFKTNRANAIATIAGAEIEAHYNVALILITG